MLGGKKSLVCPTFLGWTRTSSITRKEICLFVAFILLCRKKVIYSKPFSLLKFWVVNFRIFTLKPLHFYFPLYLNLDQDHFWLWRDDCFKEWGTVYFPLCQWSEVPSLLRIKDMADKASEVFPPGAFGTRWWYGQRRVFSPSCLKHKSILCGFSLLFLLGEKKPKTSFPALFLASTRAQR